MWDSPSKAFGDLNVAEINTPMVIKFLTPVWHKAAETGSRTRGRVEQVLNWARVHQFRDGDNPARWQGHLEHVFKTAKGGSCSAMPFTEVPAFMARLRERESASARALELVILTAARSGEVRLATWQEIDLEKIGEGSKAAEFALTFGVSLPHNYRSPTQWREAFDQLKSQSERPEAHASRALCFAAPQLPKN